MIGVSIKHRVKMTFVDNDICEIHAKNKVLYVVQMDKDEHKPGCGIH